MKKFSAVAALVVTLILQSSLAYAANRPPQVGTITPSSGISIPSQPITFTATYTDPDGATNIKSALFLINSVVAPSKCCYTFYNQLTNKLYLINDAGNAWLGGFAPGTAHTIENSYAKLDCSKTTVSRSGNTLIVKWSVILRFNFTGSKKTYLNVTDKSSVSSGWIQKGTWNVNYPPKAGTITPSSGASYPNQLVTFTTTYIDPDGSKKIKSALFLINSVVAPSKCCYTYYSQVDNKLYLINDAGNAWLGGFAPGSANVIENSYAKLDCSKTTITNSGNTLIVKWAVALKPTFTGAKKTYLNVTDMYSVSSGWIQKGTWKVFSEADCFVGVYGNRLILKWFQKPFYFSSTNQYNLFYRPVAEVDEVFGDAKAMGINVMRTWGFCDGWKDNVSFQPQAGVYSETGFARMDYIIKKAKDSGMRLIIPLVNNWSDFGGMGAYVTWSPTARKTHDAFYTDPFCRNTYKKYVSAFLNRINKLTGVRYKNDPTILIWELANEPRCESDRTGNTLQAWIEEMSAYIKSIDSNHLVSTGQDGFYNSGGPDWRYNGYAGADYIRNNQSPNIDICSFHLIYDDNNFSEGLAIQWITGHCDDAHFTINKPVYCGEYGKKVFRNAADSGQQRATRNRLYTDWTAKLLDRAADGGGFWILSANSYPDYDNYTVYYPSDSTTCSIITNFSAKMAALRKLNDFPPITMMSNKTVNENEDLQFQIPISNPSGLNLIVTSPNLPSSIGASLDSSGYLSWPTPPAGNYKDIAIDVTAGDFAVSGKMNISVYDSNNDGH